ncbi:thioredoxin domain-containing protein 17-like [Amphiura filiformis]|uniref:thioredoxin domain-containing protein 17-like n=1 Tax=Amphiura filiformis TaxID=82378 RepID=UPI003B20C17C
MPQHVQVTGIDEFQSVIDQHKDKEAYVLFCGGKDDSGKSWCPDCVAAEPVIDKAVSKLPDDAVFIYCSVGDKPFWKNKDNAFRTNSTLKLTGVPTLIKWGTAKRLVEEDCQKSDLVDMLFEED